VDPLFRAFHDVLRLPAGAGAEVVYAPLSRSTHVLSPARARAFSACRGLATLEGHAARAVEAGLDAATARSELASLAREGLLVPAAELLQRLEGARGEAPPPIAALGVPTRGRAASLREALATYAEDGARHGRALEVVIADGAASEEEAAPVRAVAAEVGARYAVPVAYAGRAQRACFAAALAKRAGVPAEIAAFALLGDDRFPLSGGANRNALLLCSVGDLCLQVDDDTRCHLTGPPDPLPGLEVGSADDLAELWCIHAGRGAPATRGFAALHEALLGRAAGDCEGRAEGVDLGDATGMLFRRLEARGGRVLVTRSGSAGDAGTGSMAHALALEGRSRERLLASEAIYRRALSSRQVIRVSPRAVVGDGAALMAMAIGLDARAVLPPFAPVQRNADGLLGAVLRRCYHDALIGYVPWAVEHAPPEARETSPEAFWASFGALGANDVIRLLVFAARVEPDREDPGRSLRALGEVLSRWGSLPLADFEEIARVQALRGRSLDLALFDDALRRHRRSPAFWARDVDRALALFRESVTRPSLAYAADLTAALGEDGGRAASKDLVRRYGELLRAWPDLWEAARELRAEGVRPAAPCSPAA
jgi:hypothetical protein